MHQRSVWKYSLLPGCNNVVDMPIGAAVVSCQWQVVSDGPCIWAIVNELERKTERRIFHIIGTGQVIGGDDWAFVGTFQVPEERLVFHVFEGKV